MIDEARKSGRRIVYLDESWVNVNHQPGKEWTSIDGSLGRGTPTGKGERIIILHAGDSNGFVDGCQLVFTSKHCDGRDYHGEMNGDVFRQWVDNQLLPALSDRSIIIMDNASYHSVIDDSTKPPTSKTTKKKMKEWLESHNIDYDKSLKRADLYKQIIVPIKEHTSYMEYTIDKHLEVRIDS